MASANPQFFTKSEISSMRVQPLRDALAERGLDTSGNGTTLKERLRDAIHPQISSNSQNANASQSNVAIVANNLADEADENSFWDILKTNQGPVLQRIPKASRTQTSIAFRKILNKRPHIFQMLNLKTF